MTWLPAGEDQVADTAHGRRRQHDFQYGVRPTRDQSVSQGTATDVCWTASRSPACQSADVPSSGSPGSAATDPYTI